MNDPNVLPDELLDGMRNSVARLTPVLEAGLVPFFTYVYREAWANGYSQGFKDGGNFDFVALEQPES